MVTHAAISLFERITMTSPRPARVGVYELLQDFEARDASIRIFRLQQGAQNVESHVHERSAQIYVALEGRVAIEHDGAETTLTPYEAFAVQPGVVHGARSVDESAVVMNISVPPLEADDQVAVAQEAPESEA
jgi:quercetin dioxygenase-like cupin family protein